MDLWQLVSVIVDTVASVLAVSIVAVLIVWGVVWLVDPSRGRLKGLESLAPVPHVCVCGRCVPRLTGSSTRRHAYRHIGRRFGEAIDREVIVSLDGVVQSREHVVEAYEGSAGWLVRYSPNPPGMAITSGEYDRRAHLCRTCILNQFAGDTNAEPYWCAEILAGRVEFAGISEPDGRTYQPRVKLHGEPIDTRVDIPSTRARGNATSIRQRATEAFESEPLGAPVVFFTGGYVAPSTADPYPHGANSPSHDGSRHDTYWTAGNSSPSCDAGSTSDNNGCGGSD